MTYSWLLPEYCEDILPDNAWALEEARRKLLDLFKKRGFNLVIPPLIEYVESLLTGTSHDMDLQTFKLVDQLSGRLLGVRPDITPQVARIDAHSMNHTAVNRLCYAGTVLHTKPDVLSQSREPYQVGAEIFGLSDVSGDIEIQSLMLDALSLLNFKEVVLDVGHVGIFRGLITTLKLDEKTENDWFKLLQNKDIPSLKIATEGIDSQIRNALLSLPTLNGEAAILEKARLILPTSLQITAALDQLDAVKRRFAGQVKLSFDLCELRGYHYHNGLVFQVYSTDYKGALARGGRYDEVGSAFGRSRPATGFSLDLRQLITFKR
ncbi:ATP phosphoribosyltransferase regulatory subunit [Ferrovum sp. JA12]|uniref:ATP phosphoribosyltransferase regulatory subunit n=1 Tax=Ferrovum sp. JA12 TaxID=1356299 RepID=UPI000703A035|nr:ATP phosphoribosyltransferase regulatory subunit [Ferrovum sp. JA12]KRH78842.1 ATP phosphoribosyltransferase regulatory subunit [Ferrovum sp. JA12]